MLRTQAKSLALMVVAAVALIGVHAGAAAAATTSVGLGTPNPNDQLTFFKAEAPLAIEAGATATASVACPTGSVALDGSAVILSVDQGGGPLSAISVTSAVRTSDGLGYSFTLASAATGRAQAKLLVSCLSKQSTGGGKLQEVAPVTSTGSVTAGHVAAQLACPADAIAIAPSYAITGTPRGYLANSQPSPSANTWGFDVVTDNGNSVTSSISCLSRTLTSGARLATLFQTESVAVAARPDGASGAPQFSTVLPVGWSGLIAGATTGPGVTPLGHEPQDRTEVFSFAGSGQATLSVIGIAITTQDTGAVHTRRVPLWKLLNMPSSRTCMSPISFAFTLPASFVWKGQTFTIKAAAVGVDGVMYPFLRARTPITITVDSSDDPVASLVLTVKVKDSDGNVLTATRHYRACGDAPPENE